LALIDHPSDAVNLAADAIQIRYKWLMTR
jgi:hypothetical protein